MDDVVVFGNTVEQLAEVFQRLRAVRLKLEPRRSFKKKSHSDRRGSCHGPGQNRGMPWVAHSGRCSVLLRTRFILSAVCGGLHHNRGSASALCGEKPGFPLDGRVPGCVRRAGASSHFCPRSDLSGPGLALHPGLWCQRVRSGPITGA